MEYACLIISYKRYLGRLRYGSQRRPTTKISTSIFIFSLHNAAATCRHRLQFSHLTGKASNSGSSRSCHSPELYLHYGKHRRGRIYNRFFPLSSICFLYQSNASAEAQSTEYQTTNHLPPIHTNNSQQWLSRPSKSPLSQHPSLNPLSISVLPSMV